LIYCARIRYPKTTIT